MSNSHCICAFSSHFALFRFSFSIGVFQINGWCSGFFFILSSTFSNHHYQLCTLICVRKIYDSKWVMGEGAHKLKLLWFLLIFFCLFAIRHSIFNVLVLVLFVGLFTRLWLNENYSQYNSTMWRRKCMVLSGVRLWATQLLAPYTVRHHIYIHTAHRYITAPQNRQW